MKLSKESPESLEGLLEVLRCGLRVAARAALDPDVLPAVLSQQRCPLVGCREQVGENRILADLGFDEAIEAEHAPVPTRPFAAWRLSRGPVRRRPTRDQHDAGVQDAIVLELRRQIRHIRLEQHRVAGRIGDDDEIRRPVLHRGRLRERPALGQRAVWRPDVEQSARGSTRRPAPLRRLRCSPSRVQSAR